MAGNDDIVARLHAAERHEFQATAYARVPVHRSDARRLFIEAATALAERNATIERLTRERDEARTEVERKDAALQWVYDMRKKGCPLDISMKAYAALRPNGGADGDA